MIRGHLHRRVVPAAVLTASLAFHSGVSARSPLDRPIAGVRIARTQGTPMPCQTFTLVDQIVRQAGVMLGFENLPDCASARYNPDPRHWQDLPVANAREALDTIIAATPAFSWRERDGIVVVRPATAWDDPVDPLNRRVRPFTVAGMGLTDSLEEALRQAQPSMFYPHRHERLPGDPVDAPIRVSFPGGSLLGALNAVAEARGRTDWLFTARTGKRLARLEVFNAQMSGTVTGEPVLIAASRYDP